MTVLRGILVTKCGYWTISELVLQDTNGVELYYQLKQGHRLRRVNILGTPVYIVFDVSFIQQMLDQSPFVFGVGQTKKTFFDSFMPLNVGVSEGCPWLRRRRMNERVLDTGAPPLLLSTYTHAIHTLPLPFTFDEFQMYGKRMASQIVFGTDTLEPDVFRIFNEANNMSVFVGGQPINPKLKQAYNDYLDKHLNHPLPNSLIERIGTTSLTREEVRNQIPHWIFPLVSLFANIAPRLLLLLGQHPQHRSTPLRQSILELLRLNNPVNSTFRTLLQPYTFEEGYSFEPGTQFLILNNPVLRDPSVFPFPNEFHPERWIPELETSYYALMFNQGPQECPGKEFVISLLSVFIQHYLNQVPSFTSKPVLDVKNIPQMINPCRIEILKKKVL